MRMRNSGIRLETEVRSEKDGLSMRRTLGLIFVAVVVAALGAAGVVVYAQQTQPAPLQPAAPAPAKKPAAAAKPQPHKSQPRPQEAQTPAAAAASVPQQQAGQQPTVFDDHARQGNIATCANLFGLLGRGLATNSNYTAQSQWDAKAGNSHSVQSLVALAPNQAPQGSAAQRAAGIVFAAPVGSSCEGNLVRVTPSAESCPTVAAELAKLNGQSGALGDLATIALPNGAQVVLIPFGNACVAVTALRVAG
ncbi:cytoskeletal protein RodZ [Bradyrhizobium sp. USDA 4452]